MEQEIFMLKINRKVEKCPKISHDLWEGKRHWKILYEGSVLGSNMHAMKRVCVTTSEKRIKFAFFTSPSYFSNRKWNLKKRPRCKETNNFYQREAKFIYWP